MGTIECIIIVVVVAVAALLVFGLYGETIQKKLSGTSEQVEGDSSGSDAVRSSKNRVADPGEQ